MHCMLLYSQGQPAESVVCLEDGVRSSNIKVQNRGRAAVIALNKLCLNAIATSAMVTCQARIILIFITIPIFLSQHI